MRNVAAGARLIQAHESDNIGCRAGSFLADTLDDFQRLQPRSTHEDAIRQLKRPRVTSFDMDRLTSQTCKWAFETQAATGRPWLTRKRSQRALLLVSGRVRHQDLHVEISAELAIQSSQQASEDRAVGVLLQRLLRLVLLEHDQSVGSLVQRVEFNARFVVNLGDRCLTGRDHLGAVFGDGKGRRDRDNAHCRCFPLIGDHPFRRPSRNQPKTVSRP